MTVVALLLLPAGAMADVHVAEGGETVLPAPEGWDLWAWDLDHDGAFDDCGSESECIFSAADLDGPSIESVEYYGMAGERETVTEVTIVVDNVPPTIVSYPETEARVGCDYSYVPEAVDPVGALDPIRFEIGDGSPPGMEIDHDGAIAWTPAAPGEYDVSVVAIDDDDGRTQQDFTIGVADDAAPGSTEILVPDSGCVWTDAPALEATAADPDGDTVTFQFRIDRDPGFRSIDLIESGPVEGSADGSARWTPSRALLCGETYYLRVDVSDGCLSSEATVTTFERCDCPDADVPEGDASPGDDVSTPTSRSGGCCGYESRESTSSAAIGFPFALFALRRTRRSRRKG